MPQLWTETIVTQYFWLVTILLGFYYLAITQIIPQIAFTLKTRKVLEAAGSSKAELISPASLNSVEGKNKDSLLNSSKSLLSTILTPLSQPVSSHATSNPVGESQISLKSSINNVRVDWIKKYSI